MSSCFLCDTSHKMTGDDRYTVGHGSQRETHYIKTMPIMVGSTGLGKYETGFDYIKGDDQQHNNNDKQNYVSYRVKKIEFRCSISDSVAGMLNTAFLDYIILFKIPFRDPVFNLYIDDMKDFILYSNPECVLKYCVCPVNKRLYPGRIQRFPNKYDLIVNKPFIVGPNDYVGVLYFFSYDCSIDASARVWFDVV